MKHNKNLTREQQLNLCSLFAGLAKMAHTLTPIFGEMIIPSVTDNEIMFTIAAKDSLWVCHCEHGLQGERPSYAVTYGTINTTSSIPSLAEALEEFIGKFSTENDSPESVANFITNLSA